MNNSELLDLLLTQKKLVTLRVTYFLPDYPSILQEFTFQDYDTTPLLPRMTSFLDFWHKNIDGKIHSYKFHWGEGLPLSTFRSLESSDFF
jgi:uncharacterized protein Usg